MVLMYAYSIMTYVHVYFHNWILSQPTVMHKLHTTLTIVRAATNTPVGLINTERTKERFKKDIWGQKLNRNREGESKWHSYILIQFN